LPEIGPVQAVVLSKLGFMLSFAAPFLRFRTGGYVLAEPPVSLAIFYFLSSEMKNEREDYSCQMPYLKEICVVERCAAKQRRETAEIGVTGHCGPTKRFRVLLGRKRGVHDFI
jgi:hypothetical protein